MNKSTKFLILVTAAGLALVSVGCGKSGNVPTVPVQGAPAGAVAPNNIGIGLCPGGQFSLGGACVYGRDFASACADAYGRLTTANGVQACKFSMYYTWPGGYTFVSPAYFQTLLDFAGGNLAFPIINPDNPMAPYGYDTGMSVRKSDTVSVIAAGGWGSASTNVDSYLGGLLKIYTTSLNCGQVDVNGIQSGSVPPVTATNESLAAGLVGSDGASVFLLGGNGVSVPIAHDGRLKIGFNVPIIPSVCASAQITQIQVTRCVDVNGNTSPPSACL